MRLRTNPHSTRIGNVDIHQLFQVLELDAGYAVDTYQHQQLHMNLPNGTGNRGSVSFSPPSLHATESQLAIIVPCMNEEQHIIEGVLRGIPHDCLIILVSNSALPKYEEECDLLEQLCDDTQRQGIAIHQQSQELARAFCAAGMPEVVNQTGACQQHVRNGKGEAMMIGVLIAKLAGKPYIGFVDADNLVPGSVHEYCKVFAAGLQLSLHLSGQVASSTVSPSCTPVTPQAHAMVRIKWNSKPKVVDNAIVFPKTGRSSRVVNEWMNRLLRAIDDGGETGGQDIVQTANAGEHAMDVELALKLRFATGYAVEPFQYIDILESFGRVALDGAADKDEAIAQCSSDDDDDEAKVRILQIQTCNPHFHDTGKGNGHIERMWAQGLGTIYHSRMTSRMLKDELRRYLDDNLSTAVRDHGMSPQLRVYPSMRAIDLDVFRCGMKGQAKTFNCSLE